MTSTTTNSSVDPQDVFKVLVATDIHLGYGEKNPILTEDSFNTFEEILRIANSRDVDFILLGGDLFHDPTPSPNSLNKCIKLLRSYVLGDKEIDFEFLSDQNQNFPDSFRQAVNYEDMNLNVAIPLFSIHGNHDDITGVGRLSSMDILSSTGLINYFGKWQDLKEVEISPIVLQKNNTKIALYGLSHIHDPRLARLFIDQKVKVLKPQIPDNEIFNLMVLHQNRADRGRNNYLPEDKLPGFLDLVVWGHEHDCRIEPEHNSKSDTYITQPGSSVATSLCEGEALEKKIGILEVTGKKFKMTALKLKTVRPFIFHSIDIDEYVEELRLNEGNTLVKMSKFYSKTIDGLIEKSKERLTGHPSQPTLPLIRLRVLCTDANHMMNTARFGQAYQNKVANPESVLVLKKKKKSRTVNQGPDQAALDSAFSKKEKQDCVEDVVETYFKEVEDEKDQLKIFSLKSLTEVCRLLVNRDDDVAAGMILEQHLEKAVEFLSEKMCSLDDIQEHIHVFKNQESKKVMNNVMEEMLSTTSRSNYSSAGSRMQSTLGDDHDMNNSGFREPPATRGRGGRAARGSRSTASSASTSRSRSKNTAPDVSDDSMLNVKKSRGAATKQITIAQSTQRSSQRSKASSKVSSESYYVDDDSN